MWHELAKEHQKMIVHSFFASYHGHSLADGHAATVKSIIRREFIASEGDRRSNRKVNYGPTCADDMKDVLDRVLHTCYETVVIPISIDRSFPKPSIPAIPEIKKKHCFVYRSNGQCTNYSLTNMQQPNEQMFDFT